MLDSEALFRRLVVWSWLSETKGRWKRTHFDRLSAEHHEGLHDGATAMVYRLIVVAHSSEAFSVTKIHKMDSLGPLRCLTHPTERHESRNRRTGGNGVIR